MVVRPFAGRARRDIGGRDSGCDDDDGDSDGGGGGARKCVRGLLFVFTRVCRVSTFR